MLIDDYQPGSHEHERLTDLMRIVPRGHSSLLDAGARDGRMSELLAPFFKTVTALDLEKPDICTENVTAVQGDVTHLDFPDNSFDVVLCTEVLEHIPPESLRKACSEISRAAGHCVVIGVPYDQDLRVAKTTCRSCGRVNPPWGHVNVFNEEMLKKLFDTLAHTHTSFVGKIPFRTNFLSAFLIDLAGNPWGAYGEDQKCLHCGETLLGPPRRSFLQKVCSGLAVYLDAAQSRFAPSRPSWMHMIFTKKEPDRPE